jgi:hypothetical protein
LLALKTIVEEKLNLQLSLLSLSTVPEEMGWHSDAEENLKKMELYLWFGAERKFTFKHRDSKETVSELIQQLVGDEESQRLLLPPTTRITTPRVNLTFEQLKYYRLFF